MESLSTSMYYQISMVKIISQAASQHQLYFSNATQSTPFSHPRRSSPKFHLRHGMLSVRCRTSTSLPSPSTSLHAANVRWSGFQRTTFLNVQLAASACAARRTAANSSRAFSLSSGVDDGCNDTSRRRLSFSSL